MKCLKVKKFWKERSSKVLEFHFGSMSKVLEATANTALYFCCFILERGMLKVWQNKVSCLMFWNLESIHLYELQASCHMLIMSVMNENSPSAKAWGIRCPHTRVPNHNSRMSICNHILAVKPVFWDCKDIHQFFHIYISKQNVRDSSLLLMVQY